MADDTDTKKSKKRDKPRRSSTLTILLMIVFSLVMIIFTQMTYVLFIIGILPTIVAYYIDVSPSRSLYHSVLACNFAGVLPYVAQLISSGNETSEMQMMLPPQNMMPLLIMYSAAALGWILYYAAPHIARFVITSLNQRKIKRLQQSQKKLLQEWGNEIMQLNQD